MLLYYVRLLILILEVLYISNDDTIVTNIEQLHSHQFVGVNFHDTVAIDNIQAEVYIGSKGIGYSITNCVPDSYLIYCSIEVDVEQGYILINREGNGYFIDRDGDKGEIIEEDNGYRLIGSRSMYIWNVDDDGTVTSLREMIA